MQSVRKNLILSSETNSRLMAISQLENISQGDVVQQALGQTRMRIVSAFYHDQNSAYYPVGRMIVEYLSDGGSNNMTSSNGYFLLTFLQTHILPKLQLQENKMAAMNPYLLGNLSHVNTISDLRPVLNKLKTKSFKTTDDLNMYITAVLDNIHEPLVYSDKGVFQNLADILTNCVDMPSDQNSQTELYQLCRPLVDRLFPA